MSSSNRQPAPAVVVAGPLPPPVTGAILVTEAMLRRLAARYPIIVHNLAAGTIYRRVRVLGVLLKCLRVLTLCGRLPWLRWRGCRVVVYLPLDSGPGQLLNLLVMLVIRLCGQRAVLHHHVNNYLVQPQRLTRWLNRTTRLADIQVFNCPRGRDAFAELYGGGSQLLAVSNSAFVAPDVAAPAAPTTRAGPLRIGHLGVLTVEKGLTTVFALLRHLHEHDVEAVASQIGRAHV